MAVSIYGLQKFKRLSRKRIRLKSLDHLELFGEIVSFSF